MRFDHLLLGVADLEAGIRELHRRSGVEPEIGGRHPELGTRNALAALGEGEYLELIAPDPGGELAPLVRAVASFDVLTPMMWAMAVYDADATAARLVAEGHEVDGPSAGSRERPDGTVLRWRLVTTPSRPGYAPFFIEWEAGTTHPSATAPGGLTLVSMEVGDPDPRALEALLDPLAPRVRSTAAERPFLRCALDGPRGPLSFSSL